MITMQETCLRSRLGASKLIAFISCFSLLGHAQPGTKLWEVTLGEVVPFSPAVGLDGTIYVSCGSAGSSSQYSRMFHAISPQGTTNWTFLAGAPIRSSPALGVGGTIYFGTSDGLYAVKPAGTTNWILPYAGQRCSSPAVGADGTIYLVTRTNASTPSYPSTLHAVSPAGTVNWTCTVGGGPWGGGSAQFSSPAIGPDGSIYVGSLNGQLYSISYSGSTNWTYALGGRTYASAAIGVDGTIYIGTDLGSVHAVHPKGFQRWTYPMGLVESTPAIDQAGNLYFGSVSGVFTCINSNGIQTWFRGGASISGSAAIAADSSVYVTSYDAQKLFAYNAAGSNLWSFTCGESFSSPVIGTNGTIYITGGTKLYAIAGTSPPQNSAWPMFRRNSHNIARSPQRSIQAIKSLSDGNVEMRLMGETGLAFGVEASTNLTVWEKLADMNFTAPSIPFTDISATNFQQRYYRLALPQP